MAKSVYAVNLLKYVYSQISFTFILRCTSLLYYMLSARHDLYENTMNSGIKLYFLIVCYFYDLHDKQSKIAARVDDSCKQGKINKTVV